MMHEAGWNITGGVGILSAIIMPEVEAATEIARFLGTAGGVILVTITIIHKFTRPNKKNERDH